MPEILLILTIALLVFGPKRLPEMGRSLGKGLREMRGALDGLSPDAILDPDPKPSADADSEDDAELDEMIADDDPTLDAADDVADEDDWPEPPDTAPDEADEAAADTA